MFSPRHAFATGVFVLVISQLFSSTAGDVYDDQHSITIDGSCPDASLGDGCSISEDCSKITCKMDFVDKPITLTLKVNKCDDPVSVTASMDVPDLYITWSHTYTSDDIVAVPGFTASLHGLVSAGVYVQVGFTPNGDELHLKVKLLAGGDILGEGGYPVKATVMEGDLPINTNACGIFAWWYEMGDVGKGLVVGGAILFVIIVIACCCCCCCCKSRPNNQGTVILQPAVGPSVMATSTNTTVPMRPLVNEI
ncbi:hypothetical protein ACROYT_G029592 [Oculina patagonica]